MTTVIVIACVLSSCGSETGSTPPPTPSTRPAGRTTCDGVALGDTPIDLEIVDRNLVPLGGTLSGLVVEYGGTPGRSIVATAGGTLEDTIESYDDLTDSGVVQQDGSTIQLLEGRFFSRPVRAALWRDPALAFPCDARAIVAEGLSAEEFRSLLPAPR